MSIALFALAAAACSQQPGGDPFSESQPTTTSAIPLLDAEILHGGWQVEIDGNRIVLAFNKQGTWTYNTGCRDPASLGTFAIEDGELEFVEFGMQLESGTCPEPARAANARFLAVLRSLDSADLDDGLLTLASTQDAISLSRIS